MLEIKHRCELSYKLKKLQVPVKNILTKITGSCNIINRYLIKIRRKI
jgi:hypothetical protein